MKNKRLERDYLPLKGKLQADGVMKVFGLGVLIREVNMGTYGGNRKEKSTVLPLLGPGEGLVYSEKWNDGKRAKS